MGGEISGTIDESIRHAVTKFAHIHFSGLQRSQERIIRMGENPANVHMVGLPARGHGGPHPQEGRLHRPEDV